LELVVVDDLAERGTPEFYREQVGRLMRLASESSNSGVRLELLDIATVFQKLADRAAAIVVELDDVSSKKSA
jgi:hypothetical protein